MTPCLGLEGQKYYVLAGLPLLHRQPERSRFRLESSPRGVDLLQLNCGVNATAN
jgi:hypothetical protein